MSLRQKLYRMFILGTEGGGYKNCDELLGGIIFFTHDIQSVEQFKKLTSELKSKAVFLSIDQEGGRVERTENIHGGKKYLSAKYAFEHGEEFLKNQTEQIAKELKSYGINLNFAPCIDVNTNPQNPIIGERAFSDNPEDVIKCEKIVSDIYRKNGIMPCVKHFPGHGDAATDSHLTLPEIDMPLDEMEKVHIKPFEKCAKSAQMVMVAHLHCTCFEKEKIPCSLSKTSIDYLRTKLGFKGIVVSDDMIMKGVADFGAVQAVEKGIKAGINMFIYRNSSKETIEIIETILKKASFDDELKSKIEESFDIINKVITLLPL